MERKKPMCGKYLSEKIDKMCAKIHQTAIHRSNINEKRVIY